MPIVYVQLKIRLSLRPAVSSDTMFVRLELNAANDMNADAIGDDPKGGLPPIGVGRFPRMSIGVQTGPLIGAQKGPPIRMAER
jgi:hypothetical protein